LRAALPFNQQGRNQPPHRRCACALHCHSINKDGINLHTGEQLMPFEQNLWAVPLSVL